MAGDATRDASLLSRPFAFATRLAIARPWWTVSAAALLALASVVLTVLQLGFKTSRLELLDPNRPENRLWIEYIEEFGEEDDVVVVIEGPGKEAILPAVDALVARLESEPEFFHDVLGAIDRAKLASKGLYFASDEEVAGLGGFVEATAPIARGDWSRLRATNLARELRSRLSAAPNETAWAFHAEEARRFGEALARSLATPDAPGSPWPAFPGLGEAGAATKHYFLANQGRLATVVLRLSQAGSDGFTRGAAAIGRLRAIVAEERQRWPELRLGLTGLPIMEFDEMAESQSSMTKASLISLVGVTLLVVAGFGGLRHALLANLVLLIGMAWSFGYVTLTVGHLNILSVSFTVTLIGIGIDYGIHFVARYLRLREEGQACEAALIETGRSISPAITTGAVTTAVAFFAAGMTRFQGVAEMGLIAGGGILLCAAAELLVLPAVLVLVDGRGRAARLPRPLPMHTWFAPLARAPRMVFGLSMAATLVAAAGLSHLWYDHNLLNLQPIGLESVALEQKLLTESDQSAWYAISLADTRGELFAKRRQFERLPCVERCEEIVSMLPEVSEARVAQVARVAEALQDLPAAAPTISVDPPAELSRELSLLEQLLGQSPHPMAGASRREISRARSAILSVDPAHGLAGVSAFQQGAASELLVRLAAIARMASRQPPTIDDLPEALVHRFYSSQGRHALRVYGRGPLWEMPTLERFVGQVRRVDRCITGNPVQTYEASLEMQRSYEHAALYALLVIVAVLVIDFQSVRFALLAGLPLAVGTLQLFGLLGWLGTPVNPANVIVLPLLLGIGVDYGVHVVHDFREQSGPYRMSPSIAVAVVVDSLTTIVGFGSLMVAQHQGLKSLGWVLTLGVTCCLLASVAMLPCLLTILSKSRTQGTPSQDTSNGSTKADALRVDLAGEATTPLRRPMRRALEPVQESFATHHVER